MPSLSSGIKMDANLLNLKAMNSSEIRKEVSMLMVEGEVVASY